MTSISMSDNVDAVWTKLDKVLDQGASMQMMIAKHVGDTNTANATIAGELKLVNQRMEQLEMQQRHYKNNTDTQFTGVKLMMDKLAGRIEAIESRNSFLTGKKAGYGFIAVSITTVVALIANIWKVLS